MSQGSPAAIVARKMIACAQAVEGQSVRESMKRVGVLGKDLVGKEVRKDFGADMAMSNWRRPPKRQIKLGFGFEQPKDNQLVFAPRSLVTGLWQVAEQGRRSGSKPPRRRRGGGRRSPSSWGPSRGKRTWSRSMGVLEDKGTALYAKVQRDKVIDAFKKG